MELIQTAGKEVIMILLDVLDDCEGHKSRLKQLKTVREIKEGVKLVFNKLRNTLTAKGLKPMEVIKQGF